MYVFNEKFVLTNDFGMPYSLTEETLHPYTSNPGKVENGKFFFAREGARLILKTPELKDFEFSCKMGFVPPASSFGKHIIWTVYFGYNPAERKGKMFEISYAD